MRRSSCILPSAAMPFSPSRNEFIVTMPHILPPPAIADDGKVGTACLRVFLVEDSRSIREQIRAPHPVTRRRRTLTSCAAVRRQERNRTTAQTLGLDYRIALVFTPDAARLTSAANRSPWALCAVPRNRMSGGSTAVS